MIKDRKVQFIPPKLNILLVIDVMFLLAIFSCSIGKPEQETEISHASGYYSFNPGSIFELLSNGNETRFKQIDSVDYPIDKAPGTNSVSWSQEDFFYVMQLFHKFRWQEETGSNWDVVSAEFRTSCEDKKGLFQSGNYLIFQVDSSSGRATRKTHRIVINPSEGTIWWSETELHPVVEQWLPVNLENLKISATEADSIAEINGGQAIRLDVGNDCVKIISGYHDEWRVAYYLPASNKTVLEFFVNNTTGEYRKRIP